MREMRHAEEVGADAGKGGWDEGRKLIARKEEKGKKEGSSRWLPGNKLPYT